MKRVLCFGDSNTWGYVPARGTRYPENVRWTGIVQEKLGPDYCIIEEGLNGRTTVWEDPVRNYMNGIEYLGPCLLSHDPLDLVVIMLGTNDTKQRFHLNAWSIAEGVKMNVDLIKKCTGSLLKMPEILVVSPILINDALEKSPYADEFEGDRTIEISKKLGKEMERVAKENGCHFMDAALYAKSCAVDSLHMEPEDHKSLADAMADKILSILK